MLKFQRFNCKTHGFRTSLHFGPHIWNNLPQDFRHSTTLSSFKSKLKTFLRIFQLSNIVHHPYQSVQFVCVVCVCACIFCIVTLEPSSTLCVSFSFFFLVYIFITDNISISMYIMCIMLRLFSALSHRVGSLQISIIIIIIHTWSTLNHHPTAMFYRSQLDSGTA